MYPVAVSLPIQDAYDARTPEERRHAKQREEGRAAYARKDWPEVLRLLTPLREFYKTDPEFFNTLGNAYFFLTQAPSSANREKNFDAALDNYREALKIAPKNAVYSGNVGNLWRTRAIADSNPPSRREKWQEAATAYESSVTLLRGNSIDLNYLGMCYFALGRFAEAEKVQREAIAARPNAGPSYIAGLWFNVGEDCLGQKKWPEAESAYREAVNLAPKIARFQNSLGLMRFVQEKFAEAEAPFREAYRLDPKVTQHPTNLGSTLLKLGRPDDARPLVQEARRLGLPDSHWAVIELGLASTPRQ